MCNSANICKLDNSRRDLVAPASHDFQVQACVNLIRGNLGHFNCLDEDESTIYKTRTLIICQIFTKQN